MSTAPLSLGIDIGGTFTDLVIHDPRDGRAVIWKESTTPDDPARGAIEGTRRVLEKAGARPEQVGRVVHATTLFTNALIERKGARTGLLTTAGFRDVLEIGRERKYELYDLFIEMPKPLVARPWRREAKERLAQDGTVEIPLDVDAALAEVADLVSQGVESLAICFLHAYANPAHERAIGAADAERYPAGRRSTEPGTSTRHLSTCGRRRRCAAADVPSPILRSGRVDYMAATAVAEHRREQIARRERSCWCGACMLAHQRDSANMRLDAEGEIRCARPRTRALRRRRTGGP